MLNGAYQACHETITVAADNRIIISQSQPTDFFVFIVAQFNSVVRFRRSPLMANDMKVHEANSRLSPPLMWGMPWAVIFRRSGKIASAK
jgi:hypothetical protein